MPEERTDRLVGAGFWAIVAAVADRLGTEVGGYSPWLVCGRARLA